MKIENIIDRNFTKISDEYKNFALEKSKCRKCSIFNYYKKVGQSEGNAVNPTFMFVGEALGQEEVELSRPFVGRAGRRLRAEIRKHKIVFNRMNTIITNVLACRPLNNKFPTESFEAHSIVENGEQKSVKARDLVNFCVTNWLHREIRILRPKVIVTLGAKSLNYVRGDSGITANRGSWKFIEKYRAWSFATYHPSYVLRCQNDESKFFVVEDFVSDIEKIAKSWHDAVNGDARMSMNDEEWKREKVLSSLPPRPVNND